VEVRPNRDGSSRYHAKFRDVRGRKQAAGTFGTETAAKAADDVAEAKAHEGRGIDPRKGRQKFGKYVEDTWFPNHVLELRGRENYTIYLNAYILPYFGKMNMIQVWPEDVREFVKHLQEQCVRVSSIEYSLTVLSAIFTTALNDQVVFLHPCKGVSAPTRAKKIRKIITPEQFDTLYDNLASDRWQLLVEIDIELGLRWGELTELRPKDFDFPACKVAVTRVVVELIKKYHPEGRFVVKDYPKDEEHREVTSSPHLGRKIQAFVAEHGLGRDDLIFAMPLAEERTEPILRLVLDPASLGWTEPNDTGRTYRHGTKSAYSAGKCRCEHCKASYAIYRAERRGLGKDAKQRASRPGRSRKIDTDGHIPRHWFRNHVWLPAREAAGLSDRVTPHSLRNADASWL
jgi:integrase